MEILFVIFAIFVVLIVFYFVRNYRRNSDPLNRKCASEICQSIVEKGFVDPAEIEKIFRQNARYQKQALHVVSMVPTLLQMYGCPREFAMSTVMALQHVAFQLSK